MESHNPNDERFRFCGKCDRFFDAEGVMLEALEAASAKLAADGIVRPPEIPGMHYKLDADKNIVECTGDEWGAWFSSCGKQRLLRQEDVCGVHVSTVFLGLNHRFTGEGEPHIFETMAFLPDDDEYQTRCGTWEHADEQHAKAVAYVRRYQSWPRRLLRWLFGRRRA